MCAFSYMQSLIMSVRLSVYCDKDGNHTIRSAITENPMLHSNLSALYVTEAELLPTEVVRWGNRDFQHIWLLWPWPWPNDLHMTFPHCTSSFSEWLNVREHRILTRIIIYELDLYPLEIYWMRENEIPMWRLSKVIIWQTDRTEIMYHAASWVVNNNDDDDTLL